LSPWQSRNAYVSPDTTHWIVNNELAAWRDKSLKSDAMSAIGHEPEVTGALPATSVRGAEADIIPARAEVWKSPSLLQKVGCC
jgi:hypothetical protein